MFHRDEQILKVKVFFIFLVEYQIIKAVIISLQSISNEQFHGL